MAHKKLDSTGEWLRTALARANRSFFLSPTLRKSWAAGTVPHCNPALAGPHRGRGGSSAVSRPGVAGLGSEKCAGESARVWQRKWECRT